MSIQGVPTLCEFKDNNSRKFECVNLLLGAAISFYSRAEEGKYRSNEIWQVPCMQTLFV